MPDLVRAAIPQGMIVKWTGTLASIPPNFQLCDGTNGTPDLRSKFVKGVLNSCTNPGGTGGADSVTLTTAQIPAHNHSVSDPQHKHSYTVTAATTGCGNARFGKTPNCTFSSSSATTGITVGNKGCGSSHENRPAYFQVAFIMKMDDS